MQHKGVIGWTIAELKGINASIYIHMILLQDDAKLVRQIQGRLNPIYAISYSKWVSPTQVVPKKEGIIIVPNKDGELIPTRVTIGWRMCINDKKLNSVTRKEHFPLPFMDQHLERVAIHTYYYFLDGNN